ncbi:nitroreductase [Beijerinckia sp. L45]|uniref:nitroreductase family protein n=1 Tax=Beijerinckia sp. L45 TaxID=1641855 RepID=UPI00131DD5E1|nr:nitroreductase [Beijerinckia sp. L45]
MNEIIRLLETRRSAPVPMLGAPGPSPEQTQALLTIASRVPDHGKIAPWRFIVFEGEARTRAGAMLAEVFASQNADAQEKRLAVERARFSAPLVIGVVSRAGPHIKVPEWEQVLSAGAVCMNLTVAANALGFATVWLTEWYAYDRQALERFGLGPDEKMAGFIHIGSAPAPREDRPRPALADVVTRF